MGFDKIFDILAIGASWWSPEKVKARARQKLQKLKEEESDLLFKEPNAKNSTRIVRVRRDIKRLQDYLANN